MKRLLSLPFIFLTACSGLDSTDKTACNGAGDCGDAFACISFVCEPGDPAASDTDGDGLTDGDEVAGWTITVDERGYGLSVSADLLTERAVTSDPTKADSDGDGLNDREEFLERSDPMRADTDGDGLNDGDEKRRWGSNLLSVDTDGDARNPNDSTLPLARLFDGAELEAGTSPTEADTDGDGKTDFEERDDTLRSPRVAEIPQAKLEVAGNLTVQMNVTYSDSMGVETTYGEEFSTTEGSRNSVSDMESTAVTIAASSGGEGFFDDLEFSKEGAIKFFGGKALELGRQGVCQAADGGRVEFDSEQPSIIEDAINGIVGLVGDIWNGLGLDATGACDAATPETTNTTSTTITRESYREATETYSEYRTESQTRTETAANGTVSVGFTIENTGISTIELVNPTITMMQWQTSPSPDAVVGAGAFRTLATLSAVGQSSFTLSPNDPPVLVQMANTEVNADFIKDFLARPQAIFFSPAQFNMSDRDGVNFEFLTEKTFGRTATLVIDDGVSETVRYQVATNVSRTENGDFAGITMGEVLGDVLEIPYTTKSVERRAEDGSSQMVDELESIGNLANQRAADRGDPAQGVAGDSEGLWVVYVKRPEQADPLRPFDDVTLFAGDEVRLVYVRDIDGDGLMAREEAVYGSDDDDDDTDDDGLNDFQELKSGWSVTIEYTDGGSRKSVTYRVSSNPVEVDSDNDGWTDLEEMRAGTDPNNADTDDDGQEDRCDVNPLDPDVREQLATCEAVPTTAYVSANTIRSFDIDDNGALTPIEGSLMSVGNNPEGFVVTSSGALAYVATSQTPAFAMTRDPDTGALAESNYEQLSSFPGLTSPGPVLADPTSSFIYVAHDGDQDGVFVYAIDKGAAFGRLSSIQSERFYVSRPEVMVMDPLGNFLYSGGSNREIGIHQINWDPMHPSVPVGGLLRTSPDPQAVPVQPDAIAIDPNGGALYLSGRSMSTAPYRLIAFTIEADGTLTEVVQNNPGATFYRDIEVHPSGSFVYAANDDAIALYTVNANTGTLTWVDVDNDPNTDVGGVKTGFALDRLNDLQIGPNGRKLFAVTDTMVHTFDIMEDGFLVEATTPVMGGGDRIYIYSEVP